MIKLYLADIGQLDTSQKFDSYLCKVNAQRRMKVLRCKNEDDQKRSLLAGVLLKYAIEQEGYCYEGVEFGISEEGKPYLVSIPRLFFSLSHSGKYAICAIADCNIGVDVECAQRFLLRNDDKLDSVARKILSSEEFIFFESASTEERKEIFLKNWTRKEAVSKAVGKGLAMDFAKICEPDEKFFSFWLEEEHYISLYCKEGMIRREDVVICTMN